MGGTEVAGTRAEEAGQGGVAFSIVTCLPLKTVQMETFHFTGVPSWFLSRFSRSLYFLSAQGINYHSKVTFFLETSRVCPHTYSAEQGAAGIQRGGQARVCGRPEVGALDRSALTAARGSRGSEAAGDTRHRGNPRPLQVPWGFCWAYP